MSPMPRQAGPESAPQATRHRARLLAALVTALILAVGGLVWWQVERTHDLMRQQMLAQAEQRSLQLADAMAGQMGGLLAGIDLALRQLRREWQDNPEGFDARARAALESLPPGAVSHVTVVGQDGFVLYNSLGVRQRTYVGDRAHFRAQQGGGDRLVIGKPVMSRLGNAWTFIVNRPILRDGRFAGTLNMSVSSEYLSVKLAALGLSDRDVIALLHADGSFLARSQDFRQAMGKGVPADRPLLAPGAPVQGIYRSPGTLDQVPRIYAWHRLNDYGLITSIGLAEASVLAPLKTVVARDRLVSAALVALVAAFGAVVVLLLLRSAREQAQIAASESFRRRVFDSSPVPIVVMDAGTFEFLDCNPAATRIYRHATRAETLGKTPLDVSAPLQYDGTPSAEKAIAYIQEAQREGAVTFEWRHQRPDGELWDAEVNLLSFQAGPRRLLQFTLQDITERKRAQQALRESEQRFRTQVEHAPEAIVVFDADSNRFVEANGNAERLFGMPRETLLGLSPVDLSAPTQADGRASAQAAMAYMHEALDGGAPVFEWLHRNAAGQDIPCELRLVRLPATGRNLVRGSITDISERKRTQEALRQSEQRFRLLFEQVPTVAVQGYGPDGTVRYWNRASEVLYGYGRDEALGRNLLDLIIPPALREDVRRAVEHMARSGEARPAEELELMRKDGSLVPVFSSHVVLDSADAGRELYCLDVDLSDRKRAEAALRRSEERYTLAAQIGHSGAWEIWPEEGRIFFDGNLTRLLGYEADELSENLADWVDTVPEQAQPDVAAAIQAVVDGRSDHYSLVHPVRRKDGSIGWVQVQGRRVSAPGEKPLRLVGSSLDITERKQADEALHRLNEELEERVQLRTVELLAAKLEAERASRAKSEFLSRMSHELRTPLNAILGFGQLLELGTRDPEQADNVQEIMHAGRHLLELINEILDLARIEAGRLTVSREPVPLMPLVEDCLTLIRPMAEARRVRVSEGGRDCGEHVLADRVRLKQVLLNLLSNAVKYNREGGDIAIACVHEGGTIQVRVSDTGAGLSAEQQARLFTAFERLDADQTAVEGTGIGLALSRRLVELMGGEIGVDSTPGQGSTFWLRLPATDGQALPDHPDAGAGVQDSAAPRGPRRDVLCIEDNPANLRLIERILARRDDVRLLSAATPTLGLELAMAHRPALILLDINLPDMDGYEVMTCLRENPATRHIPVVAVSANAMPADLARGRAAGFADYITKPVDVDRLMQAVEHAFKPLEG